MYLEVSGVDLSRFVSQMVIDTEPIWNTKAGRTLDATFTGRIVAKKAKLNIGTRPLTQEESSIIHNALKVGDFVQEKYIAPDSADDTLKTGTFYVSPQSNTVYSYVKRYSRYSTMTFNLIEQ